MEELKKIVENTKKEGVTRREGKVTEEAALTKEHRRGCQTKEEGN